MFIYDHLCLGTATAHSAIGEPRNLAELLALIFRQFKVVASLHSITIEQLKRVRDGRHLGEVDVPVYTNQLVWNQIQASLQLLLNEYLDVKNAGMYT